MRTDAQDPRGWTPAIRADVGRLRKAERTPTGGIRVPGAVSRAGVLEYRRADGSTVRELVLPDELRRLESLRSLRDAAVTVGHPDGGLRLVSPETYRRDSVGHVSGEPHVDADHVVADLAILDADAVRRVDAGELVEISAGYRVLIDATPGVWNGQRYDQVQRNREYNHVALLPAGGGRAGASVALRLDGAGDAAVQVRADDVAPPPLRPTPARAPEMRADTMATERIDGVDYEIGSTAHSQARAKFDAAQGARLDALEKQLAATKAELDPLKAKHDGLEKENSELKKKLEETESPARMDALVTARLAFVERARKVLGAEVKLDGKGELDIMREVLAKADPELKLDGKSDDYIRHRFEFETDRAKAPSQATQARADAFKPPPAATVPAGHNRHTVGRTPPTTIR